MNIEDKLKKWAQNEEEIASMQEENNRLKAEIEAQVLRTEKEIRIPNGPKCILTSRGTFNWKEIAAFFKPDEKIINKFTTIAWNKIADELSKRILPADYDTLKKQHQEDGPIFAQCRIK